MPRFEPFAAIRYAAGLPLADVTAPPYDVLSDADRAALAARHPDNVVVIDLPLEVDGPGRYDAAAKTLRRWLDNGVLIVDDRPCIYRYRMTFADESGTEHTTTGVFGALEVLEHTRDADVLPHEQTTPKAKTDRLDLTRSTNTNLSAVWGLSLAPAVSATFEVDAEPLGDFTDEAGVRHRLDRIVGAASLDAITAAVGSAPVVIADGHHRYEIARVYRRERRAANGDAAGPYDLTLTLVTELAEDQLFVQAIHRLLSDVPTGFDLKAHLATFFDLSPAGAVDASIVGRLRTEGSLCLVGPDGSGTFLHPRPELFDGVRDLDSARLEYALASVEHTKAYQHGVELVTSALLDGQAQWGVLLRPVTIAEIQRTAHEHLLMPPKSTFFAPKPKTGLVFRAMNEPAR